MSCVTVIPSCIYTQKRNAPESIRVHENQDALQYKETVRLKRQENETRHKQRGTKISQIWTIPVHLSTLTQHEKKLVIAIASRVWHIKKLHEENITSARLESWLFSKAATGLAFYGKPWQRYGIEIAIFIIEIVFWI